MSMWSSLVAGPGGQKEPHYVQFAALTQ